MDIVEMEVKEIKELLTRSKEKCVFTIIPHTKLTDRFKIIDDKLVYHNQ